MYEIEKILVDDFELKWMIPNLGRSPVALSSSSACIIAAKWPVSSLKLRLREIGRGCIAGLRRVCKFSGGKSYIYIHDDGVTRSCHRLIGTITRKIRMRRDIWANSIFTFLFELFYLTKMKNRWAINQWVLWRRFSFSEKNFCSVKCYHWREFIDMTHSFPLRVFRIFFPLAFNIYLFLKFQISVFLNSYWVKFTEKVRWISTWS